MYASAMAVPCQIPVVMVPVLGVMTRPLYEVAPVIAPVKAAVVPLNEPPVNEVPVTAPRLAVVEYKLVAVSPVDEAFPRVVCPVTLKVPLAVKDEVAVIVPAVKALMVAVTACRAVVYKLEEVALVKVAFVLVRLVMVVVARVAVLVVTKLVVVAVPETVKEPVVSRLVMAAEAALIPLVIVAPRAASVLENIPVVALNAVAVVVAKVEVPVTPRVVATATLPVKLAALDIV